MLHIFRLAPLAACLLPLLPAGAVAAKPGSGVTTISISGPRPLATPRPDRAGDPSTAAQGAGVLATGWYHSCGVPSGGGSVKCWGSNYFGELGDGTTTHRRTPVDVVGLTSDVTAISAGTGHTCALTAAGGVKCWGLNFDGELGDGTTTGRLTPVDVVGLTSGATAITAGSDQSCAVTAAGGAKCWGRNGFGQLGDGTTTDRSTPVDVVGLTSGVAAIIAAQEYTCTVTAGGGAKCWGNNAGGQLGDGTKIDRHAPVDVRGLTSGVVAITAVVSHSCALTGVGDVKCWGNNAGGQLGDGTTTSRRTPVDVVGLGSGVTTIAAGAFHTCALTAGGGAKCWGSNGNGQLGDGTTTQRLTPVTVLNFGSASSLIAAGTDFTCGISAGGAKCWGRNKWSGLGNGTNISSLTPADVVGLDSGILAMTAGQYHACALTDAGEAKCWGRNHFGQLGDGGRSDRNVPGDVSGLTTGVAAIAAGNYHTCAVTGTGGVKCWGSNNAGQLGDRSTRMRLAPAWVDGLWHGAGAITVVAGYAHTCILTDAGGVKCWGYNASGQLGNGGTMNRGAPGDVTGLGSGAVAIAAGRSHTCAVIGTGGVKCWGDNTSGQLGDGTTAQRLTPVDVVGITGALAVFAGDAHTCALIQTGDAKCWGDNAYGQLGDGTRTQRLTPVAVGGLAGVTAMAAGNLHTCALTDAGDAKCWGYNQYGQLGDGTRMWRASPVEVREF
jgi:alpha-tubulin suppressor-like RCC1 family protein